MFCPADDLPRKSPGRRPTGCLADYDPVQTMKHAPDCRSVSALPVPRRSNLLAAPPNSVHPSREIIACATVTPPPDAAMRSQNFSARREGQGGPVGTRVGSRLTLLQFGEATSAPIRARVGSVREIIRCPVEEFLPRFPGEPTPPLAFRASAAHYTEWSLRQRARTRTIRKRGAFCRSSRARK